MEGECPIKMGGIRCGLARVSPSSQLGLISSKTKSYPRLFPTHSTLAQKRVNCCDFGLVSTSLNIVQKLSLRKWVTHCKYYPHVPHGFIVTWMICTVSSFTWAGEWIFFHLEKPFQVWSRSTPFHQVDLIWSLIAISTHLSSCHRHPPTLRPSSVPSLFNAGRQRPSHLV